MNETDVKKLIKQYNKGGTGQTEEQRILNARIANLRRYDTEQIQIYNQKMLNDMGDSVVRITSQDPNLGKYLTDDTERQYGDEYWIDSNAEEALKQITSPSIASQIITDLSSGEKQYLISNIKSIYDEVKKIGKGKLSASYLIGLIKSKYFQMVKPVIDLTKYEDEASSYAPRASVKKEEDLGDDWADFGVSPDEEPVSYGRNPGHPQSFFQEIYERMRNILKREQIETLNYVKENAHRRNELTADDIEALFTNGKDYFKDQKHYAEFGIALGIIKNKSAKRDDVLRMALAKVRNMRGEYRNMISNPSSPLFNIDEDEPIMPRGYAEVSAETDKEITGNGLSFNKRMPFHHRNVIVGRGLEPTENEPTKKRLESRKYYDKIYIDLDKLSKGILYCKYISHDQPITSLRTQKISKEARDMIKDIIADKYNIRVFKLLNRNDKRLVRTFADKFNYSLDMGDDEDEELQKQFEVLLGQYEAGNNDEKLKAKLRSYVRIAIKEDLIPYKEALGLLVELS